MNEISSVKVSMRLDISSLYKISDQLESIVCCSCKPGVSQRWDFNCYCLFLCEFKIIIHSKWYKAKRGKKSPITQTLSSTFMRPVSSLRAAVETQLGTWRVELKNWIVYRRFEWYNCSKDPAGHNKDVGLALNNWRVDGMEWPPIV